MVSEQPHVPEYSVHPLSTNTGRKILLSIIWPTSCSLPTSISCVSVLNSGSFGNVQSARKSANVVCSQAIHKFYQYIISVKSSLWWSPVFSDRSTPQNWFHWRCYHQQQQNRSQLFQSSVLSLKFQALCQLWVIKYDERKAPCNTQCWVST